MHLKVVFVSGFQGPMKNEQGEGLQIKSELQVKAEEQSDDEPVRDAPAAKRAHKERGFAQLRLKPDKTHQAFVLITYQVFKDAHGAAALGKKAAVCQSGGFVGFLKQMLGDGSLGDSGCLLWRALSSGGLTKARGVGADSPKQKKEVQCEGFPFSQNPDTKDTKVGKMCDCFKQYATYSFVGSKGQTHAYMSGPNGIDTT